MTDTKKEKSRFDEFVQQFNAEGVKIGFKLPGNDFLFEYDSEGGWQDQQGKYYDRDGILVLEQDDFRSDDQDEQSDDDIIDQFQQMLIDEQEGKPALRKKNEKPVSKSYANSDDINFEAEAFKYIEQLKNKVQTRQGILDEITIYFKMKSKLYQRIKPIVQQLKGTTNSNNQVVKKLKQKTQITRKQLLKNNPWLKDNFVLEYSGSSLDEGIYDRYWYGRIKVGVEKYKETIQGLRDSKQLAILKSKSFYALKSKFYLKTKMKETIQNLKTTIKETPQTGAIEIQLNNLPQDFPMSFLLDLVQLNGGLVAQIQQMDILDQFSAVMVVKKNTALKIMNTEGYCHDEKEYIWLQVQDLKRQFKFDKLFNIEVDAPYKVPNAQLYDTMTLLNDRSQVAKICEKQEKFRLIVNQNILQKVLMFRGETLNVARVIRFEKKEEKKKEEEKKEKEKK